MAAHFLFKLASLLQAVVFARFVPRDMYEAIYVFAFEGCIFSIFLIGEEIITPSFLPVFMSQKEKAGERAAWRFANTFITLQLLFITATTALVMLFPEFIAHVITSWDSANDPVRYKLAVNGVRLAAPALFGLSIASTTYAILNGYKRFFLAAFGDAAWKFCLMFFVLIGMGFFGVKYKYIVYGLLAGSILKLLVHLIGLRKEITFFRLSFSLRDPAVKQMLFLMLPLLAGILCAKARDIFNNVYILSMPDLKGLMQANSFGRKLHGTIGFLIPYAISIAMFPFFCELVNSKESVKFGKLLSRSGYMLLSLFIPLSFVIAALAQPVVAFLFEGGEFSHQSVHLTAISTVCYTLALPAFSLEYFLIQAFFANKRMVSITLIGIIFSFLSVTISYIGIVVLGMKGIYALITIALGYTISRTLKTIVMIIWLKRIIPCFPLKETAIFFVKTLITAVAAVVSVLLILHIFNPSLHSFRIVLLLRISAASIAALCVFLISAKLVKLAEPFEMLKWALEKIRRKKNPHPETQNISSVA